MICRYCGKKIPEGSSFCPSCGKRLEAHLRAEDREKEEFEYKPERENENEYEYEESKGKRRVKAFISIIAAIIFVVGAFVAIMVFAKPYLGEEPWSDTGDPAVEEEENIGFPKNMYIAAGPGIRRQGNPFSQLRTGATG